MKVLKYVSLIFLIVGVVSIVVAIIWNAVDSRQLGVIVPFIIGVILSAIGLLGLITFFFDKIVTRKTKVKE